MVDHNLRDHDDGQDAEKFDQVQLEVEIVLDAGAKLQERVPPLEILIVILQSGLNHLFITRPELAIHPVQISIFTFSTVTAFIILSNVWFVEATHVQINVHDLLDILLLQDPLQGRTAFSLLDSLFL